LNGAVALFEDSSHFNTFLCKYFIVVVVVEIKLNRHQPGCRTSRVILRLRTEVAVVSV